MLLQLLPEVREEIFSYCSLDDLKNISLTSRTNRQAFTPRLFQHVAIPPFDLPHANCGFFETRRRGKQISRLLRNTETLRIVSWPGRLNRYFKKNVCILLPQISEDTRIHDFSHFSQGCFSLFLQDNVEIFLCNMNSSFFHDIFLGILDKHGLQNMQKGLQRAQISSKYLRNDIILVLGFL